MPLLEESAFNPSRRRKCAGEGPDWGNQISKSFRRELLLSSAQLCSPLRALWPRATRHLILLSRGGEDAAPTAALFSSASTPKTNS